MKSTTFLIPKNHVMEDILSLGNELACHSETAEEYIFDFQGKGLDTPFGMIYIAHAIREFIKSHPNSKCTPIRYQDRGYAAHMGYFQACGFEIGNPPGEAHGSETYLPITVLQTSELREQAKLESQHVGDIIESRASQLACLLTQQRDGPLVELLTYALREMIRNVIEHSGSETFIYSAQYHPRTKQAEIAILDTGMGIRASLEKNPYLKIKSHREALNLALMPGVSGKMHKDVKKDPYDAWQNSGYGLYAVSRLCGHGGKFSLISGDTGLSLKPESKGYHEASFQGTALRIILSSKEIPNLQAALSRVIKEGSRLAKELQMGNTEANVASQMLSSEFRKE